MMKPFDGNVGAIRLMLLSCGVLGILVAGLPAGCSEKTGASSLALPEPQASSAMAAGIHIAGPDEQVISASQFAQCNRPTPNVTVADTPDSPPNMVRLADGQIMLTAGAGDNAPFFSRDGINFQRTGCRSILPSRFDQDPARFAYWDWLIGFYTRNGRDMFALVHDEFHGTEFIPACRARLTPAESTAAMKCLQIALTGYVSHDQGQSFAPLPYDRPLAAPDAKLTSADYGNYTIAAVRDPSNIVVNPNDGYAYILAGAAPNGAQAGGTCVLRSRDPLTQPWLAWDGGGFHTRMDSPYAGRGATCTPVRPWGIATQALSYNTAIHKFIAIGQSDNKYIVYQTSPDLISWSAPVNLRPNLMPNWYARAPSGDSPAGYFALIDPSSSSPDFDISGKSAYLYYVKFPVSFGKVMWRQREIWRVKLSIQP